MAEIWKKDRRYDLLKLYVDYCTRSSYSSLEVKNWDKVPQDAPVMFIGNHSNTLLDAMLVLQAVPGECAFGARADIFKNPKVAAFLRFLRIVPLARERDGLSAVAGNLAVFEEVVDCLGAGVPFCMFPEGTHRTKHSLLPFKKGAFRIAVQAAAKFDKTVYMVPVGIDLEDYFDYRKKCVMTVGDPIPVTADSDMNELKKIAAERLSGLFTYFPDDENYDSAWAEYQAQHAKKPSVLDRLLLIPAVVALLLCLSCCWPMVVISWVLCRRLKDKAWSNTMRFASKLALLPFCTLGYAIPAFFQSIIWGVVAIFVPALTYGWFYELYNYIRFAIGRKNA
ncbi:MAG: 1-acyl-sn-glycerol-3-phosphate acyltransferase [Bacteroidales bacterium]|nr:1-acyl-sn-glycerol-3-phosphate acyltransferase [Candidatus Cryptobacteroides equifaecalis]